MKSRTSSLLAAVIALSAIALPARAQSPSGHAPEPTTASASASASAPSASASAPSASASASAIDTRRSYHLGAHAELDVGALVALKQGAAFAGGVVYGPFRAGLSYATFLSNKSFGGTPDGFTMRANFIVGLNVSYFIAQRTDEGLYVQGMFHIKQQGVTNNDNGAHVDLNSLAAGLELGYVWKVHRGLYVAPRLGALYYLKKPQGSGNRPVLVGGKEYDNERHKSFDTYLIPTLSVGYSW